MWGNVQAMTSPWLDFPYEKTSFLIKTKCKILVNLTVEFFILACKCYTIILFEIFNERKDDVMVKTH